jgi:hypothetical protein
MSLSNIQKHFTPDTNFWEINPQLIIIKPFSDLYENDKSKGKNNSSKDMWVIFFMSEPDDDINKFARMAFSERLKMLKETYHNDFKETDQLIKQCIHKYSVLCLTAVERALKQEIESMQNMSDYLANQNLDELSLDAIKKLIEIRSKTPKVLENYEKLEQRFIKQKSEARLRGGRKKSKSEKGELFSKITGDNTINFE